MEEGWALVSRLAKLTTLQVISYLINVYILLNWTLDRIVLQRFLVGRWEGIFTEKGVDGVVFHCRLLIAGQRGGDNTGLFFYEKEDLQSNRTCSRGVDSLDTYEEKGLFLFRRVWRPNFFRSVHVSLTSENEDAVLLNPGMPKQYKWECRISSLWFRPKMSVVIQSIDKKYDGHLAKH